MIKLEDIKGRSALSLLEKYEGDNPYLEKLSKTYQETGRISLTDTQTRYIIENHNRQPLHLNKVVNITEYLGLELQKGDSLSFVPTKILVEFMLAETEKAFHVYGKLKKNQKESKMYWLPKTQVEATTRNFCVSVPP